MDEKPSQSVLAHLPSYKTARYATPTGIHFTLLVSSFSPGGLETVKQLIENAICQEKYLDGMCESLQVMLSKAFNKTPFFVSIIHSFDRQ